MQSHYHVVDIHVRLTKAGPRGEIILARGDMPCGVVAYGPRGGGDPLSLWPVADTPDDLSAYTLIGCRHALRDAWPDLIGPVHWVGTYNRDMRAFGLEGI